MKKCFALVALLFAGYLGASAQNAANTDVTDKRTTVEKPSRDFVMIKLTSSGWANGPDSINTKGIGRGFAASIMYDFPIKKSHFSFAAGLGINAQNIFFDNQVLNFKDTGSQVLFTGSTAFKRYKFTTTRLEMPLEVRFFANNKNRNRGFKASIGANVGLFLSAHAKGVSGSGGSKFNDKVTTKRFMEQWNFAPTMRIGYGNLSLFGSYSLTPIFKEGAGPAVLPFSAGICLTGL
ncbi:MAG: outer membrane beta-barrel protein [Bacteroidota bacterium]